MVTVFLWGTPWVTSGYYYPVVMVTTDFGLRVATQQLSVVRQLCGWATEFVTWWRESFVCEWHHDRSFHGFYGYRVCMLKTAWFEYPVAQLVEALRYKPEGRRFDSRLCHRHNSSGGTMAVGSNQPSKSNGYQEYFLMGKGGRCVGLTTLPPSCADCLEIWEPQGLSRPVMELLYLFTHKNMRQELLTEVNTKTRYKNFHRNQLALSSAKDRDSRFLWRVGTHLPNYAMWTSEVRKVGTYM